MDGLEAFLKIIDGLSELLLFLVRKIQIRLGEKTPDGLSCPVNIGPALAGSFFMLLLPLEMPVQ